jgi:hypothetical protein
MRNHAMRPKKSDERKALREAIKQAVERIRLTPAKGSEGRAGRRSK